MPTAEDLIRALNVERNREQALVETLSETERARHGTYAHWSAKDLLAHINAWKHQVVLYLREDPAAVSEATDEDVERANVAFFQAYEEREWGFVLDDAASIHQILTAELRRLSESELDDTQRFPWQEGLPLWRRLGGWIIVHPMMHLAEHDLEKGDLEAATAEVHQMAVAGLQVSDHRHWTGALEYNTACILARAEAWDEALQHLEAALKQRPDLIEGSKQDANLTSLRSDPRLTDLYASLES